MKLIYALLFGSLLLTSTVSADLFEVSAIINSAQEIPAPSGVPTTAGGFALLEYDDTSKELSWNIAWQDLSGDVVGMHIHGPATAGNTAGVALNVGGVSGLTSPSIGSAVISDDFAASLLAGESYINIHTSANAPGEIRGQVNPGNINLLAGLDTAQEIPAPVDVSADAGGTAWIAYDPETNLLGWNIGWENLTGPPVGMHFHGPAGVGETAGVNVNIGEISGLSNPSIGSTTITEEFADQLLNNQWYINVHTATNGPGEIRGQVVPEPSSVTTILVGLGFLACLRKRPATEQNV